LLSIYTNNFPLFLTNKKRFKILKIAIFLVEGSMDGENLEDSIKEAKRVLEETIELAKKLYGRRWMRELNIIEERFGADPYDVLDFLKKEADLKGIK